MKITVCLNFRARGPARPPREKEEIKVRGDSSARLPEGGARGLSRTTSTAANGDHFRIVCRRIDAQRIREFARSFGPHLHAYSNDHNDAGECE